jgi:hypothetical protein
VSAITIWTAASVSDDACGLYRNDGKANFEDVTLAARIGDALYGLGVPGSSTWTTTARRSFLW